MKTHLTQAQIADALINAGTHMLAGLPAEHVRVSSAGVDVVVSHEATAQRWRARHGDYLGGVPLFVTVAS